MSNLFPQDNTEFLRGIGAGFYPQIWVAGWSDFGGGFAKDKLDALPLSESTYVAAALQKRGAAARSNANFDGGWLIVLDDVGVKLEQDFTESFAPAPTYRILTSPGNEQWGYRISPIEKDPHRWKAFYVKLRKTPWAGGADNSGLGAYKRMPFGLGSKDEPGKKNFKTHLTYWAPTRTYSLDELAAALGFSLDDLSDVPPPIMEEVRCERMSLDLLKRCLQAIPNDEEFADRDSWVRMGHSIFGASNGDAEGLSLWLDWTNQVPQGKPGEPERVWNSFSHATVRSGAGFIRKHLERVAAFDLYAEARVEAAAFEDETGFSDSDDPVNTHKDQPVRGPLIKSAAQFVAEFSPPDYLVDGVFLTNTLSTVTAQTNAGKTGLLTLIALAVAAGRSDILGREVQQGRVVYWAAENAADVRMRLMITADTYGIDLEALGGALEIIDRREAPERIVNEMNALARRTPYALLILDTLIAGFDATVADENDRLAAQRFLQRLRQVSRVGGKPGILVAAHPIKNALEDNLVPAGAGTILNEVDANFSLWRENKADMTTKFHWCRKLRGIDFEPLYFKIDIKTSFSIMDSKDRPIPLPVLRPLLDDEVVDVGTQKEEVEQRDVAARRRILAVLAASPAAQSTSWISKKIGSPYTTTERKLTQLFHDKLVERSVLTKCWWVSEKGKKELKAALTPAPEDGESPL